MVEAIRGNEAAEKEEDENKLLYSLQIIAEGSQGITPEDMFNGIRMAQKLAIGEIGAILSRYVAIIINDDEFLDSNGINSCSFQVVIKRFLKAREENDESFLRGFRVIHRRARASFDDPEIKRKIQSFISKYKSLKLARSYQHMINTMMAFWTESINFESLINISRSVNNAIANFTIADNTNRILAIADPQHHNDIERHGG
mmetsp:Transcript_17795/g.18540  ORF Transcript_17795/g.18540 Transcript_17795/m.18540 type:complete len:201 (-) Transcript_17795:23-625(-)|eukprot:CAMPEP_0174818010 /NCGR_PEP_ID=MMETSP1107-20130205/601_1 /TAXON_ID=36770 /ORGANISM="Paraphysomonas vestita, Strain GFlagA" /LENGTH=200 /DNA_ID=CAMNT_0016029289 /DNA_START=57 /DNA_END=659 /DNA_ORIENTATION=+